MTDLSLYDTEARLVLRHRMPDNSTQEIGLIIDLSQELLGSMIDSVRVVVTRHLQSWKQKNIISEKRGSRSVKNLSELLEKAEDLLRN